jgi:hypothetical protein
MFYRESWQWKAFIIIIIKINYILVLIPEPLKNKNAERRVFPGS